jgi:hypothetical protein
MTADAPPAEPSPAEAQTNPAAATSDRAAVQIRLIADIKIPPINHKFVQKYYNIYSEKCKALFSNLK